MIQAGDLADLRQRGARAVPSPAPEKSEPCPRHRTQANSVAAVQTRGVVDVAMVQTLARKDDITSLTNGYGLAVADECHQHSHSGIRTRRHISHSTPIARPDRHPTDATNSSTSSHSKSAQSGAPSRVLHKTLTTTKHHSSTSITQKRYQDQGRHPSGGRPPIRRAWSCPSRARRSGAPVDAAAAAASPRQPPAGDRRNLSCRTAGCCPVGVIRCVPSWIPAFVLCGAPCCESGA